MKKRVKSAKTARGKPRENLGKALGGCGERLGEKLGEKRRKSASSRPKLPGGKPRAKR